MHVQPEHPSGALRCGCASPRRSIASGSHLSGGPVGHSRRRARHRWRIQSALSAPAPGCASSRSDPGLAEVGQLARHDRRAAKRRGLASAERRHCASVPAHLVPARAICSRARRRRQLPAPNNGDYATATQVLTIADCVKATRGTVHSLTALAAARRLALSGALRFGRQGPQHLHSHGVRPRRGRRATLGGACAPEEWPRFLLPHRHKGEALVHI